METESATIYTPGSDNIPDFWGDAHLTTANSYQGSQSLHNGNAWAAATFDNNSNDVVWAPVTEGTVEFYWQYHAPWGDLMLFQMTGKSSTRDPLYDTDDGVGIRTHGLKPGIFDAGLRNSTPITLVDGQWYRFRLRYKHDRGMSMQIDDGPIYYSTSTTFGPTECLAWHQILIGNDRLSDIRQNIDNFAVYDHWIDYENGGTVPATAQLTETVLPANADDKSVTWSSNDTNVATIDANGLVTPVATGTCTITVTTNDGGYTAGCIVNVNGGGTTVDVTGVSLNQSDLTIGVGQSSQLTALVEPSNATNQDVNWSSDNTSVASVEANGIVSALSTGQAVITVTTDDGGYIATCNISVETIVVSSGYAETFGTGTAATIAEYTGWDNDSPVVYSGGSSYPGYSKVDITTASELYDGASGGSNVQIAAGYNGSGWFKIEGINTAGLSDVTLNFGYAYESWSTLTSFTVQVSTDGSNWTQLTGGTSTGTTGDWSLMTYDNIPATPNLMIKFDNAERKYIYIDDITISGISTTIPVSSISLTPTTLEIDEGQTSDLTETVSPSDATDKTVSWSSSDEYVASVDTNGVVSALNAGQAIITVTTNDGGYAASCNVTVNVTVISVTSVSLSPTSLILDEGQTSDLTETVSPSEATDKTVSWSCSDTTVATVDANGVVSALNAGQVIVTVTTNNGGYTATSAVTVNTVPNENFIETFGSGTAAKIADYSGWDNGSPIVFSGFNEYPGYNKVETSIASIAYPNASGGSNVQIMAGYNNTSWFLIEGINTLGMTDATLNFGYSYNSWSAFQNFIVSISTDGVNWTQLTGGTSTVTGSDWDMMTFENLPATENLSIRFENPERKYVCLDDIVIGANLQKSLSANLDKQGITDSFNIKIYPNPVAKNDFKVSINGISNNEKLTLSIFDITGKMLYKDCINMIISSTGHSEISIKNTFRKGMYILKIDNGSISSQTKLIVR